MFAGLTTVTTSLKKGKAPGNSADVVKKAVAGAKAASTALAAFDMAKTINGQGFTPAGSTALSDSQQLMVQGLRLYGESALLTKQALAATGAERRALARSAEAIRLSADSIFASGWSDYQDALLASGAATGGPTGITVPPSP